ncbi:MAG: MlaE family ABC transporter permease [Acidobacteriota bacterium]|mgnify:CR=1 FL=1|nr:ABC transporter permease [Thermoanaerobaculaceae bacterium]
MALEKFARGIEEFGEIIILGAKTVKTVFTTKPDIPQISYQMVLMGSQSMNIVMVTGLFVGMVLAIQTAYTLAAFGAKLYIGEVVSVSMTRELGPALISLLVGGRVGAGITAELGTMNVTEQIDALRSMGADPVKKLVSPRLIAFVISLPILVLIANAMGVLGGYFISALELDISGKFYMNHVFRMLKFNDVFSGLGKTLFFAVFVTLIACRNGFKAQGGADGVGRATTSTVVLSAITILISNFFLTKLFLIL